MKTYYVGMDVHRATITLAVLYLSACKGSNHSTPMRVGTPRETFLRYNSGNQRFGVSMNTETRNELIAKYKQGYDEVTEALTNFPVELLTSHPFHGKWSACEIVHHLADSETTSAIRLRKLLVEDNPVIEGYDENQFAMRLKYNERDIAPALDAFRAARATTAQLFNLMSEADWMREGKHTEHGRYTAELWLQIYADHAHNHAAQIKKLRSALVS